MEFLWYETDRFALGEPLRLTMTDGSRHECVFKGGLRLDRGRWMMECVDIEKQYVHREIAVDDIVSVECAE